MDARDDFNARSLPLISRLKLGEHLYLLSPESHELTVMVGVYLRRHSNTQVWGRRFTNISEK